jgi:hypothetical protein
MNLEPLTAPTATVCVVAAVLEVLVPDELCAKDELSKAVARTANLNNIVLKGLSIVKLNIFDIE